MLKQLANAMVLKDMKIWSSAVIHVVLSVTLAERVGLSWHWQRFIALKAVMVLTEYHGTDRESWNLQRGIMAFIENYGTNSVSWYLQRGHHGTDRESWHWQRIMELTENHGAHRESWHWQRIMALRENHGAHRVTRNITAILCSALCWCACLNMWALVWTY